MTDWYWLFLAVLCARC